MWNIEREPDIPRWLKRKKGNSLVKKNYKKFTRGIESLTNDGDPKIFSSGRVRHVRKIREDIPVFKYELTDSYRLLYTIHYQSRIVHIVEIGDHKETLGKG